MIQSPISEFIATLKDAGYALRVEDGRLKVIHPSRPLTNEEREFIREHKPNIIQAVQNSPVQDDDWHSAIPKDAMRRYIEKEQSTWTDERRQAQADEINLMVKGFMNQDRSLGITVRGLNLNAAQEKAYRDLLPFIPADADADSPAPAHADDFPFHDMHPATREILLRHWRTWDAARRKCFVQTIKDVMKRTGYSEGNAAAFVLQTAGPVAPAQKPALTEAEKAELHKRMWPTPPGKQEPKSAVPGPDIAKLVSNWPKALRLEFAGRVGKYSNEMPINQAMSRAYNELKPDVEKNMP